MEKKNEPCFYKVITCHTNTLPGAIIKQALIDLLLVSKTSNKTSKKNYTRKLHEKRNAIYYLTSELCYIHCEIIGIDHDLFIKKIEKYLQYE